MLFPMLFLAAVTGTAKRILEFKEVLGFSTVERIRYGHGRSFNDLYTNILTYGARRNLGLDY